MRLVTARGAISPVTKTARKIRKGTKPSTRRSSPAKAPLWTVPSFVAVRLWVHDFKAFDAMSSADQDNAIRTAQKRQ